MELLLRMEAKFIFVLCTQALLAKFTLCQYYGRGVYGGPYGTYGYDGITSTDCWGGNGRLGYGGFYGLGPSDIGGSPSFAGGLMVTSFSPIAPTGLRITSHNAIEGTLAVIGNLPFLGAVVTDGAFPSAGAGAVSYGCCDGTFGITVENVNVAPPIVPAIVQGYGIPPFGLPYGRGAAIGYRGGCGSCV